MCVRGRMDAPGKEESPDLDPKIAATVLTLLLLVFSAQNQKPSDAVVQPPADAHNVASVSSARHEGATHTAANAGTVAAVKGRPSPMLEPGTPATVEERARLRKGPGTTYATISKIDVGARLTVLARLNDWYQVRLSDGQVGWVAGFLIRAPGESRSHSGVSQRQTGGIRQVLGYYTEDYPGDPTSYGSLLRQADFLDYVATFLYAVDANGRVSGTPSKRAMDVAKSGQVRTLALVHNLTPSGFDGKRAHVLLQNANSRAKAISDILDILQRGEYYGVNVDLENVYPSDRENLTAFMTELAARLRPRGYLVTISVPAKTADHATSTWVGAFDYYALGRICDFVMLMTYDEHAWTSGPGPIASHGWVEKVVRYAITQIPRNKILLGIPAYGYDWNLATGRVTALSYTQAMNRAKKLGIDPLWDSTSKSPYFKYVENGARHEVWFESSHSVRPKLDLVNKYDLGGIAIWKLGYEDGAFWEVIREKLRNS